MVVIRIVMVLAMGSDPPNERPLRSHTAQDHEENCNGLWCYERLVGEQTVISNRDSKPSCYIESNHHREI